MPLWRDTVNGGSYDVHIVLAQSFKIADSRSHCIVKGQLLASDAIVEADTDIFDSPKRCQQYSLYGSLLSVQLQY